MEVVICKLTLEALDSELENYIRIHLPNAKLIVAKCIGCCGDCATSFVVLKDGQPMTASSREELLSMLAKR